MSPGYPNTPEKKDTDLKSYLRIMVEDFKKGINNSLKEIQENTAKQVEAFKEEAQKFLKELKNTSKEVEALKEETRKSLKELQENTAKQIEVLKELQAKTAKQVEEPQKSFKELQENTTKQAMELNKSIQDLKMEVETMTKTQRETTLEIETLGKKSGTKDVNISNKIQEMEERISGAEDSMGNMDTTIKENAKCKKILTQNIQEIQDTMRTPNLPIIGVDEKENFQLKGPANIFNKL
jgi:chromosome segregation ATPase